MKKKLGLRGARIALVIAIALAVGSGVAYATGAIGAGSGNVIVGCAKNANGQLRVVDSASQCLASEHAVTFAAPEAPPGPQNVIVDCGSGQSIQQAIDRSDPTQPLAITVNGTCTESVHIRRDQLQLQAGSGGGTIVAPSADATVVSLTGSRYVMLSGLTLSGGNTGIDAFGSQMQVQDVHITGAAQGVNAGGPANVGLNNVTIDGCQNGVAAGYGAGVFINGGTVSGCTSSAVSANEGGTIGLNGGAKVVDSAFQGVVANQGGTVTIQNATIDGAGNTTVFAFGGSIQVSGSNTLVTGSTFSGVAASDGGEVSITQHAQVSGNHGGGVSANNGGHVLIQDGGTVQDNSGDGVTISGASSIRLRGDAVVANNSGAGVHLRDTSVAEFGEPNSQITGNGGWGVFCDGPPAVAMIHGAPGTVAGNGTGAVNCPSG